MPRCSVCYCKSQRMLESCYRHSLVMVTASIPGWVYPQFSWPPILGTEPRPLSQRGKWCSTELHPSPCPLSRWGPGSPLTLDVGLFPWSRLRRGIPCSSCVTSKAAWFHLMSQGFMVKASLRRNDKDKVFIINENIKKFYDIRGCGILLSLQFT